MIELETIPAHGGCQCGGHCHSEQAGTLSPHELSTVDFAASKKAHGCACGHVCPRRYVAVTGFILGAFLVLHLVVNALGWWPSRFDAAMGRIHRLGAALPVLEIGLVFIPLAVHVALGLRTLRREKLGLRVKKHHHGSDLRYWLQRVTAVILLVFIVFHVATMHRWGLHQVFRLTHWPVLERYAAGGLFDPSHPFVSAREGFGNFWSAAAGNPANLLLAQFHLLAIAAAVYHLANGVATGAEVLNLVTTPAAQRRLWHVCLVTAFALMLTGLFAWYVLAIK